MAKKYIDYDGLSYYTGKLLPLIDAKADSTALTGHTSNGSIHVPTGGTNGQVLMIQNGVPAWVTPVSIYNGTGEPSSTLGTDGDIYLQTS